jgi:hypothetical protein
MHPAEKRDCAPKMIARFFRQVTIPKAESIPFDSNRHNRQPKAQEGRVLFHRFFEALSDYEPTRSMRQATPKMAL